MPPTALDPTALCTAFTDLDGDLILSEPEPYGYRELPDTIEHRALDGDTYPRLAYRYLGSAELAWVIMDFQPTRVFDPTIRIEVGSVVYVPSQRVTYEEILSESRRAEFQA